MIEFPGACSLRLPEVRLSMHEAGEEPAGCDMASQHLAAAVPLILLIDDMGEAMREVAIVGALVGLGVIAATLSSAMASLGFRLRWLV